MTRTIIASLVLLGITMNTALAGHYQNFKVSVYCRSYEVREMGNLETFAPQWDRLAQQCKIDKIYLETHRDGVMPDDETLNKLKAFFKERGVEAVGGITYTINERNRFETFCYTKPDHRQKVKEIAEFTAKHFDEMILDDFYFTNCKCDQCIAAKGDKSWTEYRMKLMTDAAKELVIDPAKKVNPNVKVVIKYPNWYDHFPGLGFNLEGEPPIFDGIYTGTETRDSVTSAQHLQQYLGYNIFRYFENIKPTGNGGGWVDTGGMRYADRYAEQLWITLFAKAPEVTLFDIRQIRGNLSPNHKAPWQGQGTSFDWDAMMKPVKAADGTEVAPALVARYAGYTFEEVDKYLGELGKPIGLKVYKPYHTPGEEFLTDYLGMIGIPIDLTPHFDPDQRTILLTESAKGDPKIVEKIKGQLTAGKSVIITSGLLKAKQEEIADIVELRIGDEKVVSNQFSAGFRFGGGANQPAPPPPGPEIVFPQIKYFTNDSWEDVSVLANGNGYPILHSAKYSTGTLFVLAIPDNFADLYNLPTNVLNRLRQTINRDLPINIEADSKVSVYLYDNDTFIVESFRDEPISVRVLADQARFGKVKDLVTGEEATGQARQAGPGGGFGQPQGPAPAPRVTYDLPIKPHSYRVLKAVK